MRDLDGFAPVPRGDFLNLGKVPSTDPENNLFRSYLIRSGPVEKSGKFAERP